MTNRENLERGLIYCPKPHVEPTELDDTGDCWRCEAAWDDAMWRQSIEAQNDPQTIYYPR